MTLDEDVLECVRQKSRTRASFSDTLTELLRLALATQTKSTGRSTFRVKATPFGLRPDLSYDNVEGLIEYAEGVHHR